MKRNWLLALGIIVFVGVVGFLILNTFNLRKVTNPNAMIVDNIDLPFADDPKIIGTWQSVDFVKEISDFDPQAKNWQGDLFLKEMTFLEKGKTPRSVWGWTNGVIMNYVDKTASKYEIKEMGGSQYMFFEWKSGDYTIRHMKPWYYVLQKQNNLKKVINYDNSRIVDNINLPFVDDPRMIGNWRSVDFVKEISNFNPQYKSWSGDLWLKEMTFLEKGKTPKRVWGWTNGVIMNYVDKTASKYVIKEMDDSKYLFFEWKSGDYTIRHMKPWYYVLKKQK